MTKHLLVLRVWRGLIMRPAAAARGIVSRSPMLEDAANIPPARDLGCHSHKRDRSRRPRPFFQPP
jgi:hypothetical protein